LRFHRGIVCLWVAIIGQSIDGFLKIGTIHNPPGHRFNRGFKMLSISQSRWWIRGDPVYPDAYREMCTNTLRSKGVGRRSPNPYIEPTLSATQQMQIPRVPRCAGSAGLYVTVVPRAPMRGFVEVKLCVRPRSNLNRSGAKPAFETKRWILYFCTNTPFLNSEEVHLG
jgi:hypothetical protein